MSLSLSNEVISIKLKIFLEDFMKSHHDENVKKLHKSTGEFLSTVIKICQSIKIE